MKKWRQFLILFVMISIIVLASCSNEAPIKEATEETPPTETSTPEEMTSEEPPKPFTLKFYTNLSPELQELEISFINKAFPHIAVETTVSSGTNNTLPHQLTASGYTPDLINSSWGGVWDFQQSGLLMDLNPLIEELDFDTDRLIDNALPFVQSYSPSGETLFIPYNLGFNNLFYNKDIFEKFGVDFPKEGAYWDDIYDLAKILTRDDGGIKYKGFQYQVQSVTWRNQLALPMTNPVTHKSELNNHPGWKLWVETMGSFYLIPGNEASGGFIQTATIAMYTGLGEINGLVEAEKIGHMNWDMISVPVFKGQAEEGKQNLSRFYAISPNSKHQKEVFQIIKYMLSEEVQIAKARSGIVPVVKSEDAKKEFGKDLEGVASKNIASVFVGALGKAVPITPYDDITKTVLFRNVLPGYYKDGKDLNTVLREGEEEINRRIEEQKAAGN